MPTQIPLFKHASLPRHTGLTSLEMCSGAGGQALGLEQAGFGHAALVESTATAARHCALTGPNGM